MSVTQDINGKESFKRKWAQKFFILGYWIAIFFTVVWGIVSLFMEKELTFPQALLEMWIWMMGFASVITLGTTLENRLNK